MSYQIKQNAFPFAQNRARADCTRENKPRLTSRRERNQLFGNGLHETRTACIGSQLISWRPDRSNDDVVFLVPQRNFQQRLERARLRSGKSPYFTLSFRFKLIFRSRVVLGCCETCAETSPKGSSAIKRAV